MIIAPGRPHGKQKQIGFPIILTKKYIETQEKESQRLNVHVCQSVPLGQLHGQCECE